MYDENVKKEDYKNSTPFSSKEIFILLTDKIVLVQRHVLKYIVMENLFKLFFPLLFLRLKRNVRHKHQNTKRDRPYRKEELDLLGMYSQFQVEITMNDTLRKDLDLSVLINEKEYKMVKPKKYISHHSKLCHIIQTNTSSGRVDIRTFRKWNRDKHEIRRRDMYKQVKL